MLVFGDPWRTFDLKNWREQACAPLPRGPWIARHGALAARLIEAGQILQALQDEAFQKAGGLDCDLPLFDPWRAYLMALARALLASWSTGAAPDPPPPPPVAASRIRSREPEGYAFYALYPEAYALAALQLGRRPDALVIGLRSIGASLAPMAAAGVGARDFTTLRPAGDAFAREIAAPDLAAKLAASAPDDVLIVDEGPGLSGSSFAGAARFIGERAPHSRIVLMPSHANGPGSQASAQTRALFERLPHCTHDSSTDLLTRLPDWVGDLTGPALAPLQDLSGGAWRALTCGCEADWPAVDPMQERRKFLLQAEGGCFLLKFIGLGAIGARKAEMAARLAAAGLAPETLGYRHGFLIERWRADARMLDPRRDRPALLAALARYLAFRQRHFACEGAYGADAAELGKMTARNIGLALGEEAGETARLLTVALTRDAGPRIATDNRMHAHEWLVTPDGAVLKTDGVDHHAGHDLIGAQPLAWDVAAACVEFSLTRAEVGSLRDEIADRTGQALAPGAIEAMKLAWLAFELGRITLAENAAAGRGDAQRLGGRREALTEKLKRELHRQAGSGPGELQSHTLVWPT